MGEKIRKRVTRRSQRLVMPRRMNSAGAIQVKFSGLTWLDRDWEEKQERDERKAMSISEKKALCPGNQVDLGFSPNKIAVLPWTSVMLLSFLILRSHRNFIFMKSWLVHFCIHNTESIAWHIAGAHKSLLSEWWMGWYLVSVQGLKILRFYWHSPLQFSLLLSRSKGKLIKGLEACWEDICPLK